MTLFALTFFLTRALTAGLPTSSGLMVEFALVLACAVTGKVGGLLFSHARARRLMRQIAVLEAHPFEFGLAITLRRHI